VAVRNLSTAQSWCKERLGVRVAGIEREDDAGLPFVDLDTGKVGECITLIEVEPGATLSDVRPILFTKHLENTHE
jgi:hypothetical protein